MFLFDCWPVGRPMPKTVRGCYNGELHDLAGHLCNAAGQRFETLNTHVKKLETQVVQTGEAVKKQKTFIKGNEALKYHVNAIIEDDFWQVVNEGKLQEGDFDVQNSMSFSGSHWCRPIPRDEH
ncbi:hypothetical protein F2Q68_00016106 [Brassica cretica]|uniref:Uncharacterized protein n=1 Tax=Brassica cretica TaxID=69181 RepID=A0A8S9HLE1_BRACR|nr:hypothetical protein F2Q68_00016106 [Brassica cretica]